jgi:uncharacterized protein YbjT (DUF2867 family)
MRVAVVGGTGALGSRVAARLVERGDEVLVLSRGASAAPVPAGASHRQVDVTTGAGLTGALERVETVLDATEARGRASRVLVDGTRRVLEAEAEAGVGHHLAISVVNCERIPTPYHRAKTAQEEAVAGGRVPWSLLRAAQFHMLLGEVLAGAAKLGLRPTGTAPIQPVDVGVVAERLAAAVHAGPGGRLPDLAGPEVRPLGELSRAWGEARGRRLLPLRGPTVGKLGRALRDGALCAPEAAAGGPTFEDWLAGD